MLNIEQKKQRIDFLVESLNSYTKFYDLGTPKISDLEWDNLYFELVKLENETNYILSNSPTQNISFQAVTALKKVAHNHPMLSLAKTKDWNEFLQYFTSFKDSIGKDVVGMLKLDGLTCSLTYQNGYLISAETRGDGQVGEDILHNAKVINSIPKRIPYLETLVVDGEIICKSSDFEEFKNEYANSRNFASGSIRLLDSKECNNRKLTFVVWNVIAGLSGNSFLNKLQQIQEMGFLVVPWVSSFDWDAKEFLIEEAKELGYPIDGLVGRFDDIKYGESLGETGHHSRAAYAFKFYDETYITHMLNIEWTMGRTGILTPVAVFEPVEIEGSIVERASLHNYSIMFETLNGGSWVGQEISVFKANMIIPQIADAEGRPPKGAKMIMLPEVCPICGSAVIKEVSDSGTVNLICSNPNCEGKLINKLNHFCGKTGLDIKGLSKATLEKLINWNWVNKISDLYTLVQYRQAWKNQTGFGEKSVENILNAIEGSKKTELASFISALGIPLVGSIYAKEICKRVLNWEEFQEKVNQRFDFTSWESFGPELCRSLWTYDYSEANGLSKIFILTNSLNISQQELPLSGMTICVTGKLISFKNRTDFQKEIEKLGGKITSSVSKNTNFLINNDKDSTSAKNVAAKKLNIPILSEEDFKSFYLNF